MAEYSEDYRAHAEADDRTDNWKTDSQEEFDIGIPPEFGGEFEGPAPENYYAVALTNCYVATFKVIADNSDISFDKMVADGVLKLRPDDGSTVVDSFELSVELHAEDPGRKTEVLLERTQSHCFILDSVDFDVSVEHNIVTSADRQ
ncbi:MAG: organic hydroperoxide reductase OsmC/OhrA [Halovenus sp.]|jgi:organic hydroperoxide reductase OsmC/OhrA